MMYVLVLHRVQILLFHHCAIPISPGHVYARNEADEGELQKDSNYNVLLGSPHV